MKNAKKVVVALSGGVDSSVAAALAKADGCEVVGVTLRLKHPDPEFSASQLCASKNDEDAVLQTCAKLGIEHHFIEGFARFEEKVLRPAAREYICGRTPNPCCDCNLLVKFGMLAEFAEQIGADEVLTGHYAKLERTPEGTVLYRGDDLRKDQSYFLYRLDQRILSKVRCSMQINILGVFRVSVAPENLRQYLRKCPQAFPFMPSIMVRGRA